MVFYSSEIYEVIFLLINDFNGAMSGAFNAPVPSNAAEEWNHEHKGLVQQYENPKHTPPNKP